MSSWMMLLEPFLHLDRVLGSVIEGYGAATYALLTLIVFAETGLVVTPFLPGDSLLFAAGSFSALGSLNIFIVWALLVAAAFFGDTFNYWVGRTFGLRVFKRFEGTFLKAEYLTRTQTFYRKHGTRTIMLARFMPIIRTLAPFVAGVGQMPYMTFLRYNLLGGIAWVSLFLVGGYFFGSIPFVKKNFTLVILVIVLLSLIPLFYESFRAKRSLKKA